MRTNKIVLINGKKQLFKATLFEEESRRQTGPGVKATVCPKRLNFILFTCNKIVIFKCPVTGVMYAPWITVTLVFWNQD